MREDNSPFFSVIIPTRNRTELFKRALNSVLRQNFDSFEVIVINDGSKVENNHIYREMLDGISDLTYKELVFRECGHGPSYTRNYGALLSRGDYLCFLDDDDQWVDENHLLRAYKSISLKKNKVDLYFTQQSAYYEDGRRKLADIWLEPLLDKLEDKSDDGFGSYQVDASFLIKCNKYAHLNCTIIRKSFFTDIKEMDESIRYEEDREIYLRAIDAAKLILLNKHYTSYHYIPNKTEKNNASTTVTLCEKFIYQLRSSDKGIAAANNIDVRASCERHKIYTLKHLAELFYKDKEYQRSKIYCRQALGLKVSFKWFLFTLYVSLLSLFEKCKMKGI